MPSPITGVWELVSETEKALWIFTETHHAGVNERPQGRRGIAGTYTVEGNRFHSTLLVDTATNVSPSLDLEVQRDGDTFTTKLLVPGAVVPTGHVDTWRKVSDLTMTSPFSGVWQIISDAAKSIVIRTDTYSITVVERGDFRRGFAGIYTVEGNRISHSILFDTTRDFPLHIELELQREGETLLVKRLAGTLVMPSGSVDQWRKIG